MLFSDHFRVPVDGSQDWFDPILDDDTLLFVDPFLIYVDNTGLFSGGYQKIMDFFARIFEQAASIPYNQNSPRLKVLTGQVVFKEPREACLGFSIGSVDGAGSGSGFARAIISAVYASIDAGIENLSHFEELGIFSTNIKEDRISDTTINILKEEFIRYTQQVCGHLGIVTESLPCRVFDRQTSRWMVRPYYLPRNPFNDGPIILIPKKFLASINALNSQDFYDYCWEQFDDNVKDQFNVAIKSAIDKSRIVEVARNNPAWVSSYLAFKEAQSDHHAYDLENDPAGVYQWHKATERYASEHPLDTEVTDQPSFIRFLDELALRFKTFIEDDEGYLQLLNPSSGAKREKAAQLLLYGMIKHYCLLIDCKFSLKEAGKGMVSFTFTNGYTTPAFVEIKYARNSEVLQTFRTFLGKVRNGDETIYGYYFIVCFKTTEVPKSTDLEESLLELAEEHNFTLKYEMIDARVA